MSEVLLGSLSPSVTSSPTNMAYVPLLNVNDVLYNEKGDAMLDVMLVFQNRGVDDGEELTAKDMDLDTEGKYTS